MFYIWHGFRRILKGEIPVTQSDWEKLEPIHRIITIDSGAGRLKARLKDIVHDFAFEMAHDGKSVTAVSPVANRTPWTTCSGALLQFQSVVGMSLDGNAAHTIDKQSQCTHLFDLARLAMDYAHRHGEWRFDVHAEPGQQLGDIETFLLRNGKEMLRWTVRGQRVISPGPFEGHRTTGATVWPEGVDDPEIRKTALMMRRALFVMHGALVSWHFTRAAEFPSMTGACFSFQPDVVGKAVRPAGFRLIPAQDLQDD